MGIDINPEEEIFNNHYQYPNYSYSSFPSLAISKTNSEESNNLSFFEEENMETNKKEKKKIFYTKRVPKKVKQFNIINNFEQNLKTIELDEESINIKSEINGNKTSFGGDFNQRNGKPKDNSNSTIVKKVQKIKTYIDKETKGEDEEKNNKEKSNGEREDNCRLKIGRNFFNEFLIFEIINPLIKQNGSKLYFEKFPQKFIRKATNKKNDRYLGKKLKDLLTNEELYEEDDKKEGGKFMHNCNALAKLKNNDDNNNILEKSGLNKYLGKYYSELYEEYLKSETHEKKIMKLKDKGQKPEEFKKFSEFEKFIRSSKKYD